MSRSPHRSRSLPMSIGEVSSHWQVLTQIAFFLAIALVITRMTSVEILRDPWETAPGDVAVPRGPGPASALVLDLLGMLPAILVLARASLDSAYQLTRRWSYLPMMLLGIWALLSIAWSADKYGAALNAAQLFSGLCLLWAMSQIVRNWLHLRLVAAVSFGLLLVLVAQSVIYSAIDVPANNRYWAEKHEDFLNQHGWVAGSFKALQFEHKITSGEMVGFFNSANTFGAVGVFLLAISAGIGIQKFKDGDGVAWLTIPFVAAASATWIVIEARSKAAGATPLLGVALLVAMLAFRPQLKKRPLLFYWLGVLAVACALFSIVSLGIQKDGLFPGHFSNSLDFRWKYWIASARVFMDHPLLGVGWNNFGLHYLAHRLPEASEEIKDPHNFLVHFFVELGFIGGLLLIVWLLRLAWEITRPESAKTLPTESASMTIGSVIVLVTLGMVLGILVNIDFTEPGADTVLELLKRFLFLLVLTLGTLAGAMLTPHRRDIDARPAHWLFYCMVISVALLLIHNLIDFSLFEPGPMFLFMLIVGSVLGIASDPVERRVRRSIAVLSLLVGCTIWLTCAGVAAQVIVAEESAHDATENIRTVPKEDEAAAQIHFSRAAEELQFALDHVPINSDYAMQCARARMSAGQMPQAEEMIAKAISINPFLIDGYLTQANVELRKSKPDAARIQSDFNTILKLNPNDVTLHTQYADALQRLGLPREAREQYELALKYDDALPREEPKRLSAEERAGLRDRITRLMP